MNRVFVGTVATQFGEVMSTAMKNLQALNLSSWKSAQKAPPAAQRFNNFNPAEAFHNKTNVPDSNKPFYRVLFLKYDTDKHSRQGDYKIYENEIYCNTMKNIGKIEYLKGEFCHKVDLEALQQSKATVLVVGGNPVLCSMFHDKKEVIDEYGDQPGAYNLDKIKKNDKTLFNYLRTKFHNRIVTSSPGGAFDTVYQKIKEQTKMDLLELALRTSMKAGTENQTDNGKGWYNATRRYEVVAKAHNRLSPPKITKNEFRGQNADSSFRNEKKNFIVKVQKKKSMNEKEALKLHQMQTKALKLEQKVLLLKIQKKEKEQAFENIKKELASLDKQIEKVEQEEKKAQKELKEQQAAAQQKEADAAAKEQLKVIFGNKNMTDAQLSAMLEEQQKIISQLTK